MSAAVVTILGLMAWLTAVVLIIGLRATMAPPPLALDPESSTLDRVRVMAARGTGALVGSLTAGVLVMGFGGRLMMRVLAATSSDAVQGAITDMEAVVGRVTVGGTVGFVLFVGAGTGVIGWLARLALRRWLPHRSLVAGLVAAGIGAGLFARPSSLLEPTNEDFAILSPDWLAVGLILGLIATFGMVLAILSDLGAARWPVPQSPAQTIWLAPLLPILLMPPIAAAVSIVTFARAKIGRVDGFRVTGWADRFAPLVTTAAGVAGGAWTLAGALEILTA